MTVRHKWDHLNELLRDMKRAIIAYSGGVDSSLLLAAAAEVLGPNLIAVTADSGTYPSGELADAREFTRSLGVRHHVLHTDELSSEQFSANPPDRCYFCKKELYGRLKLLADQEAFFWILDGSNVDDLRDYRPGSRAASEFGVRSPLREAGFTKQDVRDCARMLNLPVWDKPSLACLASRIPYGTRITTAVLNMVQQAEDRLRVLGLNQVRVRHHGDTARIEIDQHDFKKLLADGVTARIAADLKKLGYIYVCLDLEGYRTGSMNESLLKTRADKK